MRAVGVVLLALCAAHAVVAVRLDLSAEKLQAMHKRVLDAVEQEKAMTKEQAREKAAEMVRATHHKASAEASNRPCNGNVCRGRPMRSNGVPPDSNGCGPDAWYSKAIPNLSFEDACNRHDFCYARCGTQKSTCDSAFYNDMIRICNGSVPCTTAAGVFYEAVASGGCEPFRVAQRRVCDCVVGDKALEAARCVRQDGRPMIVARGNCIRETLLSCDVNTDCTPDRNTGCDGHCYCSQDGVNECACLKPFDSFLHFCATALLEEAGADAAPDTQVTFAHAAAAARRRMDRKARHHQQKKL